MSVGLSASSAPNRQRYIYNVYTYYRHTLARVYNSPAVKIKYYSHLNILRKLQIKFSHYFLAVSVIK